MVGKRVGRQMVGVLSIVGECLDMKMRRKGRDLGDKFFDCVCNR